MNVINSKWAQINPKAYTTKIKLGDPKAYKKEINKRVKSIWKEHRVFISGLAVLTLPIFFLAWPLGYLAIREGAELEVDAARAYEKLSFMETLCEKLNDRNTTCEDAFNQALKKHPHLEDIFRPENRLALTFMALKLNDEGFKEKYSTKDTRKKWQALVEESKKDEAAIYKMTELMGQKMSLEQLITKVKEKQPKSTEEDIVEEDASLPPLREFMDKNYDGWCEYPKDSVQSNNKDILSELIKNHGFEINCLNFITTQIMSIDSTIRAPSAARRKILKLLQNKPANDSADKKLLDTVLFLSIAFSQNKEKSKILDDVNINSLAIFNNEKNAKYNEYRKPAEGLNDILWITERDALSGRPSYIINRKRKNEETEKLLEKDGIPKKTINQSTTSKNQQDSDYMQPIFTFIESIDGLSENKSKELKYQIQLAMSQYYKTPVMEAIFLKFIDRHPQYQIKENYFYIDSSREIESINEEPFIVNYNEETRKINVIIKSDYNVKAFENGLPEERNLRIKSTAQYAFDLNADNLNPKLETINLDTEIKRDNSTLDDVSGKEKINTSSDQDSNKEI